MNHYVEVAVPAPLQQLFDYIVPPDIDIQQLKIGKRILVPFGRRKLIGIITAIRDQSDVKKCKPIEKILDNSPSITTEVLALCQWAANYYHYPLGQTLQLALPKKLRQDKAITTVNDFLYTLTTQGKSVSLTQLKRAPKQANAIALLKKETQGIKHSVLNQFDITSTTIKTLIEKGWLHKEAITVANDIFTKPKQDLLLSEEQAQAVNSIINTDRFNVFLLNGITGSGKTEVYIQAMRHFLQQDKQVLVLIPEISLTPQTLQRFRERFQQAVYALHSAMNDSERYQVWLKAKNGEAKIILGTRSAIFTPFKNLGLILIDEEHDGSYKQHDTLRYHARDLAIMRAKFINIPLVLGSATPSLESYHNALCGKFSELILKQRAAKAIPPKFKVIDCRQQKIRDGLSEKLIALIKSHLQKNHQVLVFLNRRGFAPVLMCHDCGYTAKCHRCDTNLTLHLAQKALRCHHCQYSCKQPNICPECQSDNLLMIGKGTQRIEESLRHIFPDINGARIDRDSIRQKTALQDLLQKIDKQEIQLLIGTQMLAKGHHFPNVTLVAIIDIDGSLFSSDFRATEKLAQLVVQVAGRAGRAAKAGEVALQTHHPEHPLLQKIIGESYSEVLKALLAERKATALPPYTYLAIFKAEANSMDKCIQFLNTVKHLVKNQVDCFGPSPSILAKKAGKYRAELLCQADNRKQLHQALNVVQAQIDNHPSSKSVRWFLDVDP